MNYTFTDNPGNAGVPVESHGRMTDAKAAKLNNDTKKPAVHSKYVSGLESQISEPKDYTQVSNRNNISVTEHPKAADVISLKKLRVGSVVIKGSQKFNNGVPKLTIVPKEEVVTPKVEITNDTPLTPNVMPLIDDNRGRHEKTGEIPVAEVQEAVKQQEESNIVQFPSRTERNLASELAKPETKAGDIDLYNNLLHSASGDSDISHQLQGARDKLSEVKAQSNKIAQAYADAVRSYEQLKQEVEERRARQEQRDKQELSATLNDIKKIEDDNLARTSDLTSLQEQIERLREEKQALEARTYEDSRGVRTAA